MNSPKLATVAILLLGAGAPAQETAWVYQINAARMHRLDNSGEELATATPGSFLPLGARTAPDGTVWVASAAGSIERFDASGNLLPTIVPQSGGIVEIAFDRTGDAWVATAGALERFSSAGASLGVIATAPPTATARTIYYGLAVDNRGNKWLLSNEPNHTLTRVDVAGSVTHTPFPNTSFVQFGVVYADARSGPSHVWAVGSNGLTARDNFLLEFDPSGALINNYVIAPSTPPNRMMCMVGDIGASGATENLYIGDILGVIHRFELATGLFSIVATLPGAAVSGLAFDPFGNLWVTRYSGEVRRLDVATGATEVVSPVTPTPFQLFPFGPPNLQTRWEYFTTVDAGGDADADGDSNLTEIVGRSSPTDACSRPSRTLRVEGATAPGSSPSVFVDALAGAATFVVYGLDVAYPGLTLPGVACAFRIGTGNLLPGSDLVLGSRALTIPIPVSIPPGTRLCAQGVQLAGATPAFTNAVCMFTY